MKSKNQNLQVSVLCLTRLNMLVNLIPFYDKVFCIFSKISRATKNINVLGETNLDFCVLKDTKNKLFKPVTLLILGINYSKWYRSSPSVEICSKFTGDHLCWSAIWIKLLSKRKFLFTTNKFLIFQSIYQTLNIIMKEGFSWEGISSCLSF